MREKKKIFLVMIVLACLFALIPGKMTEAAAKKNMKSALKNAQKGYTVIAYNKTDGKISVYCKKSFKKGTYGKLVKGAAVVVNMQKVKSMTRKTKSKNITWIPVYMNNMRGSNGKLKTGYVYAGSVGLTPINISNISKNSIVNKAINYGFSKLGTKYVLGGHSIDYGIDCAIFTKTIYQYAGKTDLPYPHTDYLQKAGYNVGLKKSKWKPGDLIFYLKYDTYGPIDHVAVYLGKKLIMHASGQYGKEYPSGGICITRVNYGNRKPVLCVRLYGIN